VPPKPSASSQASPSFIVPHRAISMRFLVRTRNQFLDLGELLRRQAPGLHQVQDETIGWTLDIMLPFGKRAKFVLGN
jgi:hypothetical protein